MKQLNLSPLFPMRRLCLFSGSIIVSLLGFITAPAQVTPDNYDVLFLKCDGTSTSFTDSSITNPKSVTAYGNATQLPIKFNRTAGFFNGTTDYVVVPDSADWDFGTNNFTVEWFEFRTSADEKKTVLSRDLTTFMIGHATSGNNYVFLSTSGAAWDVANNSIGSIDLHTWTHFAVCRNGSTFYGFKNGVRTATWVNSGKINANANALYIGYIAHPAYLSGWIKELRISNSDRSNSGASFTVPTTQHITDANTKLLMHFDTPATSPLAPGIAFDGNDYITVPNGAEFSYTGAFTIECCFYTSTISSAIGIFGRTASSLTSTASYWNSASGNLEWTLNGTIRRWALAPVINRWNHLALVRDAGNNVYAFVNGVALSVVTGGTVSGTISFGSDITIARMDDQYLSGFLRELRFSDVARYSTAFTPTQNGFIVDSSTKLYVKGNDNNGTAGTSIRDYSYTGAKTIACVGDTKIKYTEDYRSCIFVDSETTPKYPHPVGSAKVDFFSPSGGGVYWGDGNGDYSTVPDSDDWTFGSGDFTTEAFVRFNGLPDINRQKPICLQDPDDANAWHMSFGDASGQKYVQCASYVSSAEQVRVYGNVSPQLFTWYHVAATRSGNSWRMFVNGVLLSSVTYPGTLANLSTELQIGGDIHSSQPSTRYWNGLMDNIRISKGIARYTNTFNPPEDVDVSTYTVAPTNALAFGVVPVGGSQAFPFQLSMAGSQPVSGTVSATPPFAIQSGSPFTIPTGGVATVYVSFSPTNAGVFSNTVTFTSSAGTVTRTVTGQGVMDLSDADRDGIPNYWETFYGLNPTNAADAALYPPGDRLTYLQKYLYQLNPLTPDTDGDGATDYDELFVYGTNPLLPDTDGDGIPDGWEVAHGLSPRVSDASEDYDRDGLSNLMEYQYGLTNAFQPDPLRAFTLGVATNDFERIMGRAATNRFYYDKNDRLIGAEYAYGLAIAYVYDGNNNPVRQTYASRLGDTNPLPLPWRMQNGLDGANSLTASNPWDDPDHDGWSNYQEWRGGSNPTNAASIPGASVPQTAPLTIILPDPNAGFGLATNQVRVWDNEGNASWLDLQFSATGTKNWTNATVVSIDDLALAQVSAPTTGAVHRLVWNAARDLGAGRTNDLWLRARARDVTLTGDWSMISPYHIEITTGNPMAADDVVSTPEDTPIIIDVTGNDTIQNAAPKIIASFSPASHGTVSSNLNGTLRYAPATNYFGSDSFVYSLTDGAGGLSMATVLLTVIPVNDPPEAPPYSFNTLEDTPFTLQWNTTRDFEGDLVHLKSAGPTSAHGGTVTVTNSHLTYIPPRDYAGTDTFAYVVEDNGTSNGINDPRTATGSVTVVIQAVNDPPVIIVPGPQTVAEDNSLTVTNLFVLDLDAGNGLMRMALSVTNGTLRLSSTNGLAFLAGSNSAGAMTFTATLSDLNAALTNLLYQGEANFNGADRLLVSVNDQGNSGDGGPSSDSRFIDLTVTPVNDLPLVSLVSLTNNAVYLTNETITIEANASDLDGQVLKVELFANTNKLGELTNTPYRFVWSNLVAGDYSVLARATDNLGGSTDSEPRNVSVVTPGFVMISGPGVTNRTVRLIVSGQGKTYSIEASTNLSDWSRLSIVTNLGTQAEYIDQFSTNYDKRFYRARPER